MARKILVVDDDRDVVLLLKRFLQRSGYEVIEAFSGEECLDIIKKSKPDFIILDIIMPGTDGWEVCKQIKENDETTSIPVSMLSVKRDPEDVEKSLVYARADEHLTKPVDLFKLIKTVERFI